MLQAYILSTGRRISPFDEPSAAMRIHNRSLRETQEELLEQCGCRVEVIDDLSGIQRWPCVLVHDDLYFTAAALNRFLAVAKRQLASASSTERAPGGALRAALAQSELTERFAPTFQGRPAVSDSGVALRAYDLYYLRRLNLDQPLEDQSQLVPIPHRVRHMRWRISRHFDPSGKFCLPLSSVALCPIQHWASLVTANLVGLPSCLFRAARRNVVQAMSLPLRTIWRAGSLRPRTCRGKLYVAGRGCKVDPTAYLEGVVLGRGVRIGPHAVVKGSVLDDRVEVGPGALIEGCSLGQRATVNGGVTLRCCVIGEETNIGSYYTQLSVTGRGVAMCPSSGIYDFHLRGQVPVSFQDRQVGSGSRLLGGCLGHGAFLGAEVTLSCGQELPNGCVVIRNPRQVVQGNGQKLPENVLRVDRGRARRRSAGSGPQAEAV